MKKYPKRVFFQDGQRDFINQAKSNLNCSDRDLASKIGVCTRTLQDWKKNKYTMSLKAFKIILNETGIEKPKKIEIRSPFWYTQKGSRKGGLASYQVSLEKYGAIGGNQKRRKKQWLQWWNAIGKYQSKTIGKRKPFSKPKPSQMLAEFIGICIGDGGITDRQITISLNSKEKAYQQFVSKLMKRLFKVIPSVCLQEEKSVNTVTISRTGLVDYCVDELGLKKGNKNKQKVDIPSWIMKNRKYQIACLRGLIDTDGCIFSHQYRVNNIMYSYKKISFTSYSKPLLESVSKIMKKINLHPRIAGNRDVRLDRKRDTSKYFEIVGSHNQKHIDRYKS